MRCSESWLKKVALTDALKYGYFDYLHTTTMLVVTLLKPALACQYSFVNILYSPLNP